MRADYPTGHRTKRLHVHAGEFTFPTLARPWDVRFLWIAFAAAVLVHGLLLIVNFPEARRAIMAPRRSATPIVVRRYVPPPPQPRRQRGAVKRTDLTRQIPVPDPTPDAPEPIVERSPEIVSSPVRGDFDVVIGTPSPPGASGSIVGREPILAGVGGVTYPVRIEESYVQPVYPEIARRARVEGNVVIQAVILRNGSVSEAVVLRSTQPGFGFEGSAVAAVTQWRYEPATQAGEPVDVFFTILVEFTLI